MDTGIRTDRIEAVREIVSGLLEQVPDVSLRASGYVHMFGVAEACVLLAMRRGEDIELAAAAGYLHDIATYTTGNAVDHAGKSARLFFFTVTKRWKTDRWRRSSRTPMCFSTAFLIPVSWQKKRRTGSKS